MLEEYKGEYYILNDLQNKNNPLIIQRMEDTKEDYKSSNKNNKPLFISTNPFDSDL